MADDTSQADIDAATAKAADYGDRPKPRTYVAPYPVALPEGYFKAGEPFTTAAIAGDEWELADPAESAAMIAAAKDKSPDVNFEELSVSQLRAVAAALGVVVPATVTKKADIIAVLRAKNEPTL